MGSLAVLSLQVDHAVRLVHQLEICQQTMVAHTQEGEEMVAHRPAATQMNNMMDIGSRRIFTPQQAKFEEMGEPTREAWLAMGEQGLLGISTPAEVGGVGGTFIDEMIACEEMSYAFLSSPAMALHSTITMP